MERWRTLERTPREKHPLLSYPKPPPRPPIPRSMGRARPWARVLTKRAHRRRPSPTEHPSLSCRVLLLAKKGLSRSAERPPGSRSEAKTATFDRWAKDLICWSPSHTPSYGPSSGPIGLCPARGLTYALAFFPSTPWTDANDSFPPVGRRLGISHSIWLRCPSVHLIDKCPAAEQVCGAVRVVSRSPYSGQLFPAWGKGVKFCGLVLDRKGLVSSKRPRHDQRHRGTTIRSDECSQHGERRWVQAREPMTGPENQEAACARFA